MELKISNKLIVTFISLCYLFEFQCSSVSAADLKPYKLVCYWDSSSLFRTEPAYFDVEDIDQLLCTHIVFRSVRFGTDGNVDFYAPYQTPSKQKAAEYFKSFLALKQKNPNLILLVSMGDSSESAYSFSQDGGSYVDYVRNFVVATMDFLRLYSFAFDGLDLDLNYLVLRQGPPENKKNYVILLKALRTELNKKNLLLTALVSAEKGVIDLAYDVPVMAGLVDFLNVMSFDFYGGAEMFAGINSPLYSSPSEQKVNPYRNVDFAIKDWIDLGAPVDKLVMGVATFGRSFTLEDQRQNWPGADVIGPGKAGPYLRKAGILAFYEICEAILKDSWTVEYDEDSEAPFSYKRDQWVGFDDDESIEVKTKYANNKGLAGIMFWTLDTDDFMGKCGRRHTLLMTVQDTLNKRDSVVPTPYPTEEPYTENHGDGEPVCKSEGFFRNPSDCKKFFRCVSNGHGYTIFHFDCGPGTVFDENLQTCNWPYAVPGCESS